PEGEAQGSLAVRVAAASVVRHRRDRPRRPHGRRGVHLADLRAGARREAVPQPPDRAAEPGGLLRLARPGARGGRVRAAAAGGLTGSRAELGTNEEGAARLVERVETAGDARLGR